MVNTYTFYNGVSHCAGQGACLQRSPEHVRYKEYTALQSCLRHCKTLLPILASTATSASNYPERSGPVNSAPRASLDLVMRYIYILYMRAAHITPSQADAAGPCLPCLPRLQVLCLQACTPTETCQRSGSQLCLNGASY